MKKSENQHLGVIGILITLAGLIVAVLAWLRPFNPVGPSPLLPSGIVQTQTSPALLTQAIIPSVQPSPIPSIRPSIQCLGREQIAFASNRSGNFQIYDMNIDGSCITRLTDNSASDLLPNWSPDGTRIAFTSDRDRHNVSNNTENFEVYTMNSDGTNVARLTFSGGNTGPVWSPDGQHIAYIHTDQNVLSNYSIQIISLNGSGTISLPVYTEADFMYLGVPEYSLAWSPDGQQIAFVSKSSDCAWGIFVINTDGTNLKRIPSTCYGKYSNPSWSPDGKYIAFAANDLDQTVGWWQVYLMRPDGSEIKRLTNNPFAFDGNAHPTWSPDGQHIALVEGNNEDYTICIINSNSLNMNVNAGSSLVKCFNKPVQSSYDMQPSWSPTH